MVDRHGLLLVVELSGIYVYLCPYRLYEGRVRGDRLAFDVAGDIRVRVLFYRFTILLNGACLANVLYRADPHLHRFFTCLILLVLRYVLLTRWGDLLYDHQFGTNSPVRGQRFGENVRVAVGRDFTQGIRRLYSPYLFGASEGERKRREY